MMAGGMHPPYVSIVDKTPEQLRADRLDMERWRRYLRDAHEDGEDGSPATDLDDENAVAPDGAEEI